MNNEKSPLVTGGKQATDDHENKRTVKSKIDPMKGVVKPEVLREYLLKLRENSAYARSYIRGSLQYLQRHPPNPHIVPILRHALEKFK